jgi:hypothetical protein
MDISQSNWNEIDDNNAAAAPDGAPEGMPPSGVNNTLRAMMGAIKRWYDQSIPRATDGTGTSTAYTLGYGAVPTALADGMTFLVAFDKGCGNAPTLDVNSLGAKPLYKWAFGSWVALAAGDLLAGQIVRVSYQQTLGAFRVLSPIGPVPTGATIGFRGTSSQVPAGWVIERGNSIGDAASGATELASAACEALFKLLWGNNNYVLQDASGAPATRGASAEADWVAHCRLVLKNVEGSVRAGNNSAGGSTGGAATHSHGVNVSGSGFGSGTTFGGSGSSGTQSGGPLNVASDNHNHAFNVAVSVSASGTADSQSNYPPYVTEISIIKL